ncbi:MAG: HAD family hydrolase [Oscillospiraceae bacterium]|nr:HAD family hydrolase [Oscillospiraceae bacterium]
MTLFLSDLDGTLLNYAAKLKPRSAEMLNRMISKGVLFSYATARGFQTSRKLTAELNVNLPLITMNGAIICEPKTGKPLTGNFPAPESLNLALDFFKELKETPLIYSFLDGKERVSFIGGDTKRIAKYLADRKGDERFRPCKSYEELFAGEIYYCTLINPLSNIEKLKNIFSPKNGFSNVHYEDVYNKDFLFEAFKAGVSKATALLELKKLTGADKVIAFGDNLNDIPMFEAADECYAVENAVTELKAIATGVIASNEEMGVPVFIEKSTTKVWDYTPPVFNPERFKSVITDNFISGGVGELNEKSIHASLKAYYSGESDREAKIGSFIADAAGENGIFEIQTAGWGKLKKKLDAFLDAGHVTVVYPFEQRVYNYYISKNTGELIKKSPVRNNRDLTSFFLELYRIKEFLTHPNLSICIAALEIEKLQFVTDENNLRPKSRKKHECNKQKNPLSLLSEIHLNCGEDYRVFLPEISDFTKFTRQEFIKAAKKSCGAFRADGSILLEILEYMSVVHKCGKKGREFLYGL